MISETEKKIDLCPACCGDDLLEIYRLDAIPVQSCILLDTVEEALSFPLGSLALMFCDECGFIYNPDFNPELVDYASTTEESQHFSGTFNRFARALVAEIASLYQLGGKNTLEIGCGKGDFLQEMVRHTKTSALGIDPGFIPQRLSGESGESIDFQREYFSPDTIEVPPDFIVCRHTLEHVPEVGRFMADIASVIGNRKDVGVFFETPDVRRVLEDGAFWDIYYEHCSYFTLGSHARLFRRNGLDVTRLYLAYEGQYIIQYAAPSAGRQLLESESDLVAVRALASAFPARVAETRAYWTKFVHSRHSAGKKIAIWGGGSKGVAFLTTNNVGTGIFHVIDINTHKQGKYLPATGHLVEAPEALKSAAVDTVIVMNPIYLPEIKQQLEELGLEPELVAV